jgi:hypothetical protein
MKIATNAIPLKYQESILAAVTDRKFPWFPVHEQYGNNTRMTFSHLILNDGPDQAPGSTASGYYNLFLPIIYSMAELIGKPIKKILRIRVGLILPTPWLPTIDDNIMYEQSGDDAHQDFFLPHHTGLYYINSSDGDTIIYNETTQSNTYTELSKISPEQGKICIFDGEHFHAAGTPSQAPYRLVATFNFTTE